METSNAFTDDTNKSVNIGWCDVNLVVTLIVELLQHHGQVEQTPTDVPVGQKFLNIKVVPDNEFLLTGCMIVLVHFLILKLYPITLSKLLNKILNKMSKIFLVA